MRRWALAALRQDAQLTLRFVGSREGRRLNNEFRGRDYATNVLTFPYDETQRRHRRLPARGRARGSRAGQALRRIISRIW